MKSIGRDVTIIDNSNNNVIYSGTNNDPEVIGYTPSVLAVNTLLVNSTNMSDHNMLHDLALKLILGDGIQKDVLKGVDCLERSAALGNQFAIATLEMISWDRFKNANQNILVDEICVKSDLCNSKSRMSSYHNLSDSENMLISRMRILSITLFLGLLKDVNACGSDNKKHVLPHLIVNGLDELANECILKGADLNQESKSVGTPLIAAVRANNINLIQHLIGKGADINAISSDESSPLSEAVWSGTTDIIEYLIQHGAKVDGPAGDMAITTAILKGSLDRFVYLVKHGANLHAKDKWGITPLMLAAQHDKLPIVKWLVEAGAAINDTSDSGHTALYYAWGDGILFAKNKQTASYLKSMGGRK